VLDAWLYYLTQDLLANGAASCVSPVVLAAFGCPEMVPW
jgi:hypothetical protein